MWVGAIHFYWGGNTMMSDIRGQDYDHIFNAGWGNENSSITRQIRFDGEMRSKCDKKRVPYLHTIVL
jgi:hypothetical protein